MGRFFCCVKNRNKRLDGFVKGLLACTLVLCALLAGACVMEEDKREMAQPVFFSLLFPQLTPELEPFEGEETRWWEAMFL